ncbi:MAG: HAD family hydrolase [Candidatus Aminicenantes bacterium]
MRQRMTIKGVIFDMDGTVVEAPYDWERIRAALGTMGKPILAYINSLEEPERSEKWKILRRFEYEATRQAKLNKGIPELLDFLEKKGIWRALVTNNSQDNVSYLLEKFNLEFDFVLARESGLWKPSSAPFIAVLDRFNLKREECVVIGDSHFDFRAGAEAGIAKIFILNADKGKFLSTETEIFASVKEIQRRIAALIGGR